MGTVLQAGADPAVVGFDAGWKVELRREDTSAHGPAGQPITLSRDRYYAEIKVDTAAAFRGGTFEIVVDGLTDKDFEDLVRGRYVFASIKLGWRDLGSGLTAPFKDAAALVSASGGSGDQYVEVLHGRVRTCERTAGEFRYRTKLTGVDYRWEQLRCTRVQPLGVHKGDPATRYAALLCGQAGVPLTTHPAGEPGEPIDAPIDVPQDITVSAALELVARAAHSDGAGRRIPVFLRTDGVHFGPWLAPVTATDRTPRLEPGTGLVECKPVVEADPEACNPDVYAPPHVVRHDVVLRGRADLQVGDKVELSPPLPSATTSSSGSGLGRALGGVGDVISSVGGIFGATTDPTYEPFRVIAVKHELDRARGFVTTLRVEAQPEGESLRSRSEPAGRAATSTVDEAARTAAALTAQARAQRREVAPLDVGEVNVQYVRAGTSGSHSVAAQRLDIQEGVQRDGEGNNAVRADRLETPTQLFNKPYLTPFAFGRTGLVVPHYPGMRVADLHFRGEVSQTLAAGCLWRDGQEPESHPGDWWLSLPTGVSQAESVDDSRTVNPPSGPASHDLIDGSGRRAIHVRGLRISVGEGKLPTAGTRPADPGDDVVLIEHKSGAQLRIDADGNITIKAASGKDLRIEAHTITLAAESSVEVT